MEDMPKLKGDDRTRAEAIREKYLGDKIDPSEAEQELFTMFRLASGSDDTDLIKEWVWAYLEH